MADVRWTREKASPNRRQMTDTASALMTTGTISELHLLHREHGGQNVIDARKSEQPAKAAYTVDSLTGDEKVAFLNVTQLDEQRSFIDNARETKAKQDPGEYLCSMEELLDPENPLMLLYCEDYNTKGLIGPENFAEEEDPEVTLDGQKDNSYLGLIRSIGYSAKDDTSGGNFGIGKQRLWRHSNVGTVFVYSCLSVPYRGHRKRLIGVNLLPCEPKIDDVTHTEFAYFGVQAQDIAGSDYTRALYDEEADELAAKLGFSSRSDEDHGTSVLIVGFNPRDGEQTEGTTAETIRDEIIKASNWYCWPAILTGKLEVSAIVRDSDPEPRLSDPESRSELHPFIHLHDIIHTNEELTPDDKIDRINFPVPALEPDNGCDAELVLATSARERNETDPKRSEIDKHPRTDSTALIRGAGLVVSYHYFRGTSSDAVVYHSILLGGEAHPDSEEIECQKALEKLLGWCENATHDKWDPEHPNPRFIAWKGAKKALKDAIGVVRSKLKSAVKSDQSKPEGEASPLFARMFQFGKGPVTSSERVVDIIEWNYQIEETEEGIRYVLQGEVYVPEAQEQTDSNGKEETKGWRVTIPARAVDADGKNRDHVTTKFTHWSSIPGDDEEISTLEEGEEVGEKKVWISDPDALTAEGVFLEGEAQGYRLKAISEVLSESFLKTARINFPTSIEINWERVTEGVSE